MSSFDLFCKTQGVRIRTRGRCELFEDGWQHYAMRCTLTFNGRTLTTPFKQGMAHVKNPTAADVLESLLMNACYSGQSFEDWCGELDYNPDSRKALATYEQCVATDKRLRAFLAKDYSAFVDALAQSNQS